MPGHLGRVAGLFRSQGTIQEFPDERDYDIGPIYKLVAQTIDEFDGPAHSF